MAMKKKDLPAVVEIEGVHGYIDGKGVAWLKIEDVARGLGFVQVKKDRFVTSGETVPPLPGTNPIYRMKAKP